MFTGGFYETTENGFILEVHDCDDGYDFTVYDYDLKEVDGGILETEDWLEEDFVVKECYAMVDIYENYKRIKDLW